VDTEITLDMETTSIHSIQITLEDMDSELN
jgi:hypothetical protein